MSTPRISFDVPHGAWASSVLEPWLAAVRAEVADGVARTRRPEVDVLAGVVRRSASAVLQQTIRAGAPGPAEVRRLRASSALLRELRQAPSPDAT